MEFHGIDEFMRMLKMKYDLSESKKEWRALTGRDHLRSSYDTFIFTDEKVFQVKAAEIAPKKMIAVAGEVGDTSPDLLEEIQGGSPVPLGVVSQSTDAYSVIMFGIQQYSSDIASMLKKEHYSSKQDRLDSELERSVSKLTSRPEFRRAYRSVRQTQEGYFA